MRRISGCLLTPLMDQLGLLWPYAQEHPGQMEDLGHHVLPDVGSVPGQEKGGGWVDAVICLEGPKWGEGQIEISTT